MHPTGHHAAGLRDLAAAVIAGAGLLTATAATAAAAGPGSDSVPRATAGRTSADATPGQTIHLQSPRLGLTDPTRHYWLQHLDVELDERGQFTQRLRLLRKS